MKGSNSALKIYISLVILCSCYSLCNCSAGDQTQFFHNCRANCERTNCTADGIDFQEQAAKYYQQSLLDRALQWTCGDECQYYCMWMTVEAFNERGWKVPQFYGKWPFKRSMGLQEPASVFFSLLNLISHWQMFRKFRREVNPKSPCYFLWTTFACICINGWIWSMIFHARDFPLTELLDYAFAYSIILATLCCTILRLLHRHSLFLRGLIALIFISFYVNYFAYLSVGKFSYSLNMMLNIITGTLAGITWILWCVAVRHRRPYYKIILKFYILCAMGMSLELLDFPPILWTIDAHSLWHLVTAPVAAILYEFLIEDCKALYKEKLLDERQIRKLL